MIGPVSFLQSDARFSRLWTCLVTASLGVGLALVDVADIESRRGYDYTRSTYFFWAGVSIIFVPAALRLLMKDVNRRERLTLVVLLGLSLFLVKFLGSPSAFTFSDEYVHLRNTQDILRTCLLYTSDAADDLLC